MRKLKQIFKTILLGPFWILMGGGGSQDSSSTSKPLTAAERSDLFRGAMGDISSVMPSMFSMQGNPQYTALQGLLAQTPQYITSTGPMGIPTQTLNPAYTQLQSQLDKLSPNTVQFQSPQYSRPDFQSLNGQDYEKLQSALLQGNEAGLDYAKGKDISRLNDDLAKRGIWSSGLAEKAINDVNASYAPQYAQAGANATQQRYGLQSQEQNAANTFNLANAGQDYQSQWAPLNWLQGIWNGTGGAITNSNSGGFNFNI